MTSSDRTVIALICERYSMTLHPRPTDEPWFLDWVIKNPERRSGSFTAGWLAYRSLLEVYRPEEIRTVREFFAGTGAHALFIQDFFSPEKHVISDYSTESVEHLRDLALPGVEVRQEDAFKPPYTDSRADLVALDFGDLTCWKLREGQPHRQLVDAVFLQEPKGVFVTDVAGGRLHLHRARYESMLGPGTCASYETYLDALVRWFEDTYDYELQSGYRRRASSMMMFVPAGRATRGHLGGLPPIQSTPEKPVGIELF